jgi:LCP family protein required for cell wall assembly
MGDWPQGWYQDETGQRGSGQAGAPGQPPSATPSAGRSAWPEQPPPVSAPGRARPGPPSRSGRRWRFWGQPGRRGRRIALIAGVVVVVLLAAATASYFWVGSKLNRSVTLPAFSGLSAGQNWLIAGSDGRDGLTNKQIIELHVGFDFGTDNSDSLMLLHTGTGRPVLISIPRDSYVPIPGFGYNKINAALGFGGPSLLIQTVENVTGLRIDHFVEIGFAGLVTVVDEVGGVRICLPTALHDYDSGANLKAGCQTLDGAQALAFVRDRHSFADEDLQRIQDQRAFLKALLDKATSPGVFLNPFTALPFASGTASALTLDKGTSLYDLIQAARALRDPLTGTVPIADANYVTADAGDAVLWNRTEALTLFNALKNGQAIPSSLLSGTTIG